MCVRALWMQAGIQAAAGVLLGASVVAGIMAVFLPIETMGRSLPEDTDEVHELALLDRQGKGTVENGSNDHAIPAVVAPRMPEVGSEENPFHVTQLDVPSEPAEAELDQN